MALWWILSFVAVVVIAAVVAGLLRRTRFLPGHRSARPSARRSTPQTLHGPVANDSAVPTTGRSPVTPAGDSAGPPHDLPARAVSFSALPELAGVEPAPEGIERPWDQPPDPAVLSRILERASEVLDRVAARRRVIEAISSPDGDPRALTDIVVSDPALSARVLRTVNSPVYALRQPMASVFRAVLYLGHNEVRNLVWRACFAEATADLPARAGRCWTQPGTTPSPFRAWPTRSDAPLGCRSRTSSLPPLCCTTRANW